MAAIISGTVLASLFYDHSDVEGELEGLLFGKVTQRVKDTISDSQINNYRVETKTYVYSYYKGDKTKKFYDRACRIDTQLIRAVTPEGSQVIGWFRFRHNTSPYPSLREQNIHENFLTVLPTEQEGNFVFLLCTGSPNENLATHNFDFDVLKCSKRKYMYKNLLSKNSLLAVSTHISRDFIPVPLTVLNLGDTTHSEYKYECTGTGYDGFGRLPKIINKHKPMLLGDNEQPNEVVKIMKFAEDLQSQLGGLTSLVVASEVKLHSLQEEIQRKQKMLKDILDSKRKTEAAEEAEKDSRLGQAKAKYEQKKKEKATTSHNVRLPSDSSHSRKLGNNEDSQPEHSSTPHYSRKLSTNYDFMSMDTTEANLPQESSLTDVTEDHMMDLKPDHAAVTQQTDTQDSIFELSTSDKSESSETKSLEIPSNPAHKRNPSDPFSFVEGYLAQEKSAIGQSSKKSSKGEINHVPKDTSQLTSAINLDETRSGRNTTKNKPAQIVSDTANQRITRGQRSRSRENKVGQDNSLPNNRNNDSGLHGNCAMEANVDVTVVSSDSSEEGMSRRAKEEGFEVSSSPVY